ncbi:hypothetical protein G6F31_016424 [Rhizopus arrhizus]|nr:hypothetical protein G6F31_016424 [Rhizopus arrhizus]
MPGAGHHRQRARQDHPRRQVLARLRHALAGRHLRHYGHGRVPRRLLRPDLAVGFGHDPASGPGHRAHGALGHRPDGADHPRLLHQDRRTARAGPAQRAAQGAGRLCRTGPAPRRGTGTGVLPGAEEHRPGFPAAAPGGPLGPSGNGAPVLFDRCGQRVRPDPRPDVRLLRRDEAGRRHADPRVRRGAAGGQFHPRQRDGPGRPGVPVQAHHARIGDAPRRVRPLPGQADGERAGLRHAHPPEPGTD